MPWIVASKAQDEELFLLVATFARDMRKEISHQAEESESYPTQDQRQCRPLPGSDGG